MSAEKLQTWLWLVQRASASVLAVAVAVHLITIIAAVQGGLTAAEIVGPVGALGKVATSPSAGTFVSAESLAPMLESASVFIRA